MMITAMPQPDPLRRIRLWLAVFIIGLVASGITAFPLQTELSLLVSTLRTSSLQLSGFTNRLQRDQHECDHARTRDESEGNDPFALERRGRS